MTDAAPAEGPVIRRGRAFDAPACGALVEAWVAETPWMPKLHPPGEYAERMRERLHERTVLVAEAASEVAGFLTIDEAEAEVTALFVGPRGRGIGHALLAAAKAGRPRLALWTFVANEGARRFYAREGFREALRTDGENEEGLPDIRLVWEAP